MGWRADYVSEFTAEFSKNFTKSPFKVRCAFHWFASGSLLCFDRSHLIPLRILKNQGVIKRDPNELTLEILGEEIIEKNQDSLENYENLRIPRPWEDQTEVDFMRQKNRQVKSIKEIKKDEHKKPT